MRISDWSSDVCSSDLSPWPICHLCRSFLSNDCWPNIKERAPSLRQGLMEAGCPLPYSVRIGSRCCSNLLANQERVASFAVKIGTESCRARVCKYGSTSVVAVSKQKPTTPHTNHK